MTTQFNVVTFIQARRGVQSVVIDGTPRYVGEQDQATAQEWELVIRGSGKFTRTTHHNQVTYTRRLVVFAHREEHVDYLLAQAAARDALCGAATANDIKQDHWDAVSTAYSYLAPEEKAALVAPFEKRWHEMETWEDMEVMIAVPS